MKKNVFLTIFLLCLLPKTIKGQNSKIETSTIYTSAVCDMCEELIINKTLAFEKGLRFAEMDVSTGELTVRYRKDKTSINHIRKIISELGYDADSVKANRDAYDKLHFCCKAPPKKE